MYHFVKIYFNKENKSCWYLKPENLQDVIKHFDMIVSKDISMGIYERINNEFLGTRKDGSIFRYFSDDYTSNWGSSVNYINHAIFCDSNAIDTWNIVANMLKDKTYSDRIKSFVKNKNIFLANGLQIFVCPENSYDYCKIIEDIYIDELKYPLESHVHFSDVIYSCDGLSKWSATIGKHQVKDKNTNTTWLTPNEAKIAARWYCNYLEYRIRNGYED